MHSTEKTLDKEQLNDFLIKIGEATRDINTEDICYLHRIIKLYPIKKLPNPEHLNWNDRLSILINFLNGLDSTEYAIATAFLTGIATEIGQRRAQASNNIHHNYYILSNQSSVHNGITGQENAYLENTFTNIDPTLITEAIKTNNWDWDKLQNFINALAENIEKRKKNTSKNIEN